jgi:Tfp pilus assembly protein PilO
MDKLRQWVVLTVVACLAISAAGWFLLVSPKRTEAAELRTQTQDQLSANAALENQLQVLKAQAKDLPKEQAKLAAVTTKLPDNPALPGLIRSLLEAADSTGVDLVSITPGEPVLVAPPVPVAPTAEGEGSAQQAPEPGADPAAPAPADTAGVAGQLANIPVALNVVGDYFEVQQFLAAVEDLARALRVESLQIVPGASPAAGTDADADAVEEGRSLSATVSGYVYMAANRPPPVTATVPGAEGATAEATTPDAETADTVEQE